MASSYCRLNVLKDMCGWDTGHVDSDVSCSSMIFLNTTSFPFCTFLSLQFACLLFFWSSYLMFDFEFASFDLYLRYFFNACFPSVSACSFFLARSLDFPFHSAFFILPFMLVYFPILLPILLLIYLLYPMHSFFLHFNHFLLSFGFLFTSFLHSLLFYFFPPIFECSSPKEGSLMQHS